MKTPAELFNYVVPPFSAMDTSRIAQMVSKASRERARHLEMMAAAYLKETGVPVRHAELVESHQPDGSIVWYYRDKRDHGSKGSGVKV